MTKLPLSMVSEMTLLRQEMARLRTDLQACMILLREQHQPHNGSTSPPEAKPAPELANGAAADAGYNPYRNPYRKSKPVLPPNPEDVPLYTLNLQFSVRAENALDKNRILTLRQLVAMAPRELLQLKNMGVKTVHGIQDVLAEHGYSLKDYEEWARHEAWRSRGLNK